MKRIRFTQWFFIAAIFMLMMFVPRAHSKIIVVGGLTHEHIVQPGETLSGMILIRNTGDEAEEVKCYQTDYHFFCDGTNDYGEAGSSLRSNAGWIVFSPKQTVVPPNEEISIEYRIHVPVTDSLKGTFWSMMMVEAIPKSVYDVDRMDRGVGINMIMRYGIQMVTHFGESGIRQIQFLNAGLENEGDSVLLLVDLENTGERWLRPEIWVEMFDGEGALIGNFEGQSIRTYPGTSIRQRIDLSDVPTGSYKALIVADCGDEDLFGIHYNITIEK